jgi:hypothetical protein
VVFELHALRRGVARFTPAELRVEIRVAVAVAHCGLQTLLLAVAQRHVEVAQAEIERKTFYSSHLSKAETKGAFKTGFDAL